VFSWDRLDPGTALLLEALPPLGGRGADLGCGVGVLARAVLASPKVTSLLAIDIDARAIAAARRNIEDERAMFDHRDVRGPAPAELDFVVMNPPFHDAGREDRALGQAFISAAAAGLRSGGVCWMVANLALPYEAVLAACFSRVTAVTQARGYKVYEARK
jgi:16S rRNA (guanine1207-N2)-methyltransferase